jgi:hypothetical protein
MKLDHLVQLHNDLIQFDKSTPIAVLWDESNGLIYRQLGKVQAFPYINNYYFPSPKLKLGLLMPADLVKLVNSLEVLIQDPALKSNDLNTIISEYGIKIYKLFNELPGPQLVYELNFCTFTNKWISQYVLSRFDTNSKILLKSIKNERKHRRNKMSEI